MTPQAYATPEMVRLADSLTVAIENADDPQSRADLRHELNLVRWASYAPGVRVPLADLLEEQRVLTEYIGLLIAQRVEGDETVHDEIETATERLSAVEVEIAARSSVIWDGHTITRIGP